MKIKAQCLSISNNSGISSKTGKNYSINEMYILDTEALRPEVLKLNVHENDLADARAMIGKTVGVYRQNDCANRHLHSERPHLRISGRLVHHVDSTITSQG